MDTKYVAVLIAVLGILILVGCNRSLPNNSTSSSAAARCEERWFNTSSDNPKCYGLQKALSDAVEERNITRVHEIIREGANVNSGYYQSIPVLEHAAWLGANEIIELLISNGAKVDRVRTFGGTALKAAVTNRHSETVRILIANKVDLCEATEGTALQIAEGSDAEEIVAILNDAGAAKCP